MGWAESRQFRLPESLCSITVRLSAYEFLCRVDFVELARDIVLGVMEGRSAGSGPLKK